MKVSFIKIQIIILFLLCTIILIKNFASEEKSNLNGSEIFKQFVLDTVPESVKNIKAAQTRKTGGYTYILKFNINREDLDKIIESKPFERAWNPNYSLGQISWSWEFNYPESCLVYYYPDDKDIPKWFSPEITKEDLGLEPVEKDGEIEIILKKDPNFPGHSEAYAFCEIGGKINKQIIDTTNLDGTKNTELILYNKEKSEAYFIVTKVRY